MLKVWISLFFLTPLVYAGELGREYDIPYCWGRVTKPLLESVMHTLADLPDPTYITDRRLSREEVILSSRAYRDAIGGLEHLAITGVTDKALINTLGKLHISANYGYSSATRDMQTLYRIAIKFFTELDPKPELVERFRTLREDATLQNKKFYAELNWAESKSLMPPHPSGEYPFLMIVPGGYVYPTTPLEKYRAAAGAFITRMFRRTSVSSSGSDDSRETLPLPEAHAEATEVDPLVKKKV
jgi:hypothetical protein